MEWIHDLTAPQAAALILVSAILLVLIANSAVRALSQRRKNKIAAAEEDRRTAQRTEEQRRIAALPPLKTEWLMEMPAEAVRQYYGPVRPPRGSWSSRYCHIVVADRDGNIWLGFVTREVLLSLKQSQYTQGAYYVPLAGSGEAIGANPTIIKDERFDVYPFWLRDINLSSPQWRRWYELTRNYHLSGVTYGTAYNSVWRDEAAAV